MEFTLAKFKDNGFGIGLHSLPDNKDTFLGMKLPDRSDFKLTYLTQTLVNDHGYYVTGVDVAKNEITIRNPWGWHRGEIRMSLADFQSNFAHVMVNQ